MNKQDLADSYCLDKLLTNPVVHIIIIFMLAVTLMMSKLGGSGLATYDDAFYAQKAKEILSTGDWMTMHYDGNAHFENPPFFMWLIAGSYKIFGINEYAAKFPSALMGVMTVLLIYYFGRYLFNEWIGFFSALILSTTNVFTRYAGRAMVDVALSFFITLALFAMILGIRKNPRYFLLWGLCISVSVLIKSVLGFFPAVITILFLLLTRRWKILTNLYFIIGTLCILTLGFSWYIHQTILYGDVFLKIHFGWLIFERGFEAQSTAWYDHLSYAKDLVEYYWPWLPIFIFGIWKFLKRAAEKKEAEMLCLLWVSTIFLIMSCMQTRVMWYIMPMFPAAAIICGVTLDEWLGEKRRVVHAKFWLVLTGFVIVFVNATPIRLSKERERDTRIIAPYVQKFASHHQRVMAFRQSYHSLNNALLFYSDYSASPMLQNYDELRTLFANTDTVFCILSNSELDSLAKKDVPYSIIRKTDNLSLIANCPVQVYDVRSW
jgi:4-amino-4-deoxy-L-arabinose transferase-like glycosyltransferase